MSVVRLLQSLSRSPKCTQRLERQSTRRSLFRRRLFESLEDRKLLASDWQNPLVPTDVNNDRVVSALDTLLVINKLNDEGGTVLPGTSGSAPGVFYDTSGDGRLSPLDVLRIINAINANSDGNQLTAVEALSSRSVLATFKLPVADALMFPEAYRFQADGSSPLQVLKVVRGENPNQVVLTTGELTAATYRVGFSEAAVVAVPPSTSIARSSLSANNVVTLPRVVDLKLVNNTTIMASYSQPMGSSALDPRNYQIAGADGQPIDVLKTSFLQGESESVVQLETAPIPVSGAVVNINNVTDSNGTPVTFQGSALTADVAPRVVGAISQSTTTVLVSFSEPMADDALQANNYSISQATENKEVGGVNIVNAEWYRAPNETTASRRSVLLTNRSSERGDLHSKRIERNGLGWSRLVCGRGRAARCGQCTVRRNASLGTLVLCRWGRASRQHGTARLVVNVVQADGTIRSRQVTSDTRLSDTDYDGLSDAEEFRLGSDPRSADTDGDQLSDYAEFNELYSNLLSRDTDGDSLDDYSEFQFYKTSPNFRDTDGDQISDGDEILANRNPRVSDLPRPNISVGQMNLKLDVRFEETSQTQRRDLETKSVSATISSDVKTINTTNRMNMQEGHSSVKTAYTTERKNLETSASLEVSGEVYGGGQHT